MSVQITVRDVPKEIRDKLAMKAALEGQSMQEFLRQQFFRIAQRPSLREWLRQVRERKELAPRRVASEEILAARESDRR